ncbi:hypothetical protein [Telmatospirillum siberiense]|uniref:hypothetical protein n=1 Tax=Telmatospirillum siberiense TaxID=382514 RepID=UPI0011AF9171|nr:hypothetical protein [Telmatospirillum siberiense]
MLKSSVLVMTLVSLISLPASAADKKTVSLECGGAKATLTCTKFDGDSCVASDLAFDTPSGKHVVSPQRKDIKQVFDTPIIADDITCNTSNTKAVFVIQYSPGCNYSECLTLDLFDLSGYLYKTRHSRMFSEFFGDEVKSMKQSPSVTLRGDSK